MYITSIYICMYVYILDRQIVHLSYILNTCAHTKLEVKGTDLYIHHLWRIYTSIHTHIQYMSYVFVIHTEYLLHICNICIYKYVMYLCVCGQRFSETRVLLIYSHALVTLGESWFIYYSVQYYCLFKNPLLKLRPRKKFYCRRGQVQDSPKTIVTMPSLLTSYKWQWASILQTIANNVIICLNVSFGGI